MNVNRRNFIKSLGLGVGAGVLIPSCIGNNSDQTKITILHTNDVHSRILPFDDGFPSLAGKGGFARRATLIKQIRKAEEHVLLVDAGDVFQGTTFFNVFKGELEYKLMSQMRYDVATLGNHEFDNGVTELAKQIKKATFPFVNSNYEISKSELNGLIEPYKIFKKGAIKVGVIGMGIKLEGLVHNLNYKNVDYVEPTKICDNLAKELKEKHKCNIVIALSHLGYKMDKGKVSDVIVAQNTENIDIIIGGHTHTLLKEPVLIKNKANKDVIITQAGSAGVYLGRIDLVFDSKDSKGQLVAYAQL